MRSTRGELAIAATAVFALAASFYSIATARQDASDLDDRLTAQEERDVERLKLDTEREERARLQEEQRFAVYVELAEVPAGAYRDEGLQQVMPERTEGPWWSVINSNPIAIRGVWVEGPDDQWIAIDEIQGCTVYILDPDTPERSWPRVVNFKDPWVDWQRWPDGKLTTSYEDPPVSFDTPGVFSSDDGKAHTFVLDGCGST